MFKDEMYFPHRMGARKDPKILCLRAEIGSNATAPYWDLIEILYENQDHKVEFEYLLGYANDLDYELEYLQKVINSCIKFKLFCADETHFWSNSVFKRIAKINGELAIFSEKQAKSGRISASKRYGYAVDNDGYKISNDPVTKPNDPVTTVTKNLTTHSLTKQNKTNKEKINKKESEKFPNEFETFRSAIEFFESEKRNAETEFGIFSRKHKDWKSIIPILENAIIQQSKVWNETNREPQYRKKLGNWLAERLWESFENATKNSPKVPYRLTIHDVDLHDDTVYGGDGFNIRGYDRDGYNRDGFNEYGYNREQVAERERSKAS